MKKVLLTLVAFLATTMTWADDAFVVWDATNTTLYFSYGAVPTEGGSWTPAGGSATTATAVWSGTDVTNSPDYGGPRWYQPGIYTNATKVVFENSFAYVKPTSFMYWFLNFAQVTTIEGLENLDTSEGTTMIGMFGGLPLTVLDLSNFNTSKVTDMKDMFSGCSALTSLDLSSFDTSKVTNMESMFQECTVLKSIIVGDGWNTDAVTESASMFLNCYKLVGEEGEWDILSPTKTNAHTLAGGYLTKKSVTVAANTVGSDNWATYYKSNVNRKADSNTTVYTAAVSGDKVTLTEVADKNIKAGQGVILKSTAATITLTSNTDDATADFSGNELQGVDAATATPDDNTYVLGAKSSVVGFYKYTGTNVGANKAYLTVAASARDFFGFDGISTGIESIQVINADGAVEYYDLSGRRFSQPRKGINIVKGKKVIVK